MATRARVVTAVGSALTAIALIGGFVLERHMYGQPFINPTALTVGLLLGAVLFGLLASVGAYIGLRVAGVRELPYLFGTRLALAYIALVTLIGQIPMTVTIQSDDWRGAVTFLVIPIVGGIAVPGLLTYLLARVSLPRGPSVPDKSQ
jgi:hypothetical protein